MKIDKNLTYIGVDELVIKQLLSNTKRFKNAIVESASLHSNNGTYCIKVAIDSSLRTKNITLHTTISKIRDIKINNIIGETN